jgi:hypothetical protein
VHDVLMTHPARADALLDLLVPLWQLVIGVVVLVAVVAMTLRLAGRGQSRMRNALLVIGVAILGVALIGILQSAAQPRTH